MSRPGHREQVSVEKQMVAGLRPVRIPTAAIGTVRDWRLSELAPSRRNLTFSFITKVWVGGLQLVVIKSFNCYHLDEKTPCLKFARKATKESRGDV